MNAPNSVLSEADFLEIMKREVGVRVHARTTRQLPEIDLAAFVSEYPKQTPHVQREIEEAAEACHGFLNGFVITDSFADHAERREWRREMRGRYGSGFAEMYDRNKLRINMLSWVHLVLRTVQDGIRVFKVRSPKAEAVSTLYAQLPSLADYDKNTVEQKLEIVARFDEVCKAFLAVVAK